MIQLPLEETALKIDWYFDFISPFAYFQLRMLDQAHKEVELNCVPILFGALLKHHGHKGPAEIPSKRLMTYRYCQWFADRRGIPFTFPDTHPFKPILPLRLCLALGGTREVVRDIFNVIWADGQDLNDPSNLQAFCRRRGFDSVEDRLAAPAVKDALRRNTDAALRAGVFGVPTIAVADELFWGADMLELALAYRANRELFKSPAYQRLKTLPSGI